MPKTTRTINRKQLYDKAWSTPMTAIAKEFGLSDVGMAKLCRRHEIPRPPRGYWAKVEHGQKPRRAKLPNPEQDATVKIHETEKNRLDPEIQDQVDALLEQLGPVPVRDNLRGAHRLIAEMRRYLDGCKVDDYGLYRMAGDAPLDLKVSKSELPRALRIMDALLKAAEKQRWEVRSGPVFVVLGQEIRLALSEGLKYKPDAFSKENGDHRYRGYYWLKNRIPSGEFTLTIDKDACRKRKVKGGYAKDLEERLPKAMELVVEAAGLNKQSELERQEWNRQWEERERRREEARARNVALKKEILAEQAKVDGLVAEAGLWRQSHDLRAYVETKTRRHLAERNANAMDEDFGRWRRWALDQAARMDPLCPSPPSILDEATPEVMKAVERPW